MFPDGTFVKLPSTLLIMPGIIEKITLGKLNGFLSNLEAEFAALALNRARKRHPSYYPGVLFDELMRSLPCTSLETMAISLNGSGDIFFNLVPRSDNDPILDWRNKFHGRGVMIKNSEVESDGSISATWSRLLNEEVGQNIINGPYDLCTSALDVGGRGKEIAWIHVMQVPLGVQSGKDIRISELKNLDLIDHHKSIINMVLNKLPIDIAEGKFRFKSKSGETGARFNMEIADRLWDYKNIFK